MFSFFRDSPEFERRKRTPFSPPKPPPNVRTQLALSDVRLAVPKHLYEKNTLKGCLYVARDLLCAFVVYELGWLIDPLTSSLVNRFGLSSTIYFLVQWTLWLCYWYAQGIVLAGWWCMAHEAGHGTLSNHKWINHVVGFSLHSFLLTPFYAWRASHHAHHKATMSVERDENYVPRTRKDYALPPESVAELADYYEIFEDAPLYTLLRILIMQIFGWPLYLFTNAMGSPRHPRGTNHFLPSSAIFEPRQRNYILASDVGIGLMGFVLYLWTCQVGFANFLKLYFVPFMCVNHWIVMLTYLHHCDPTIPYFRRRQWSFLRGAISTVDRPLLGWAGRFFLHNVSHDHISHHLFSSIPFYNQPMVTEHIKKVLKENYNYDSTNSFRALYRTFTQCCFIEDDGDIVFYKNKDGQAARVLAADALEDVPVKI
ncbi:delta-12 fatty acid desaturase [Mycena alexandri]|uniref:Delta-12 fatty acid desaturase n=1 Tax=Mycena alexandri TaxID=1745969 RepID=A0AAD6TBW7_9AGAR|nr:delta-12 fatty acid desaturase [Mycena alexandri]